MDKIEKYLNDNLLKTGELEGGLFAYISLRYIGCDYFIRKTLYTVKEGIVYELSPKDCELYPTGDSLWTIKTGAHRIGKYNPDIKYKTTNSEFNYSEIKKRLKI